MCIANDLLLHMVWLDDLTDNKVHGANMGPIRGQQDPGGPHVGPVNFAICACNGIAQTQAHPSSFGPPVKILCTQPNSPK